VILGLTERICFMPEHRRKFSPQFKAEAVQMVIETGKPIAEVARDLGIHDGTQGTGSMPGGGSIRSRTSPLSPVERTRVKDLEDEVARLRLENEFLNLRLPSSRGPARPRPARRLGVPARPGQARLSEAGAMRPRYYRSRSTGSCRPGGA